MNERWSIAVAMPGLRMEWGVARFRYECNPLEYLTALAIIGIALWAAATATDEG